LSARERSDDDKEEEEKSRIGTSSSGEGMDFFSRDKLFF
jgi:hypothetical protein